MAPKRAKFYTYGDDPRCTDVKKYIEDSGILLDIRDMAKHPLTRNELADLIGTLNIEHFLNKLSEAYSDNKLDERRLSKPEILDLMAANYTLVRQPIIVSSRLLTIGYDKKKIAEMLQINANGQAEQNVQDNRGNRRMAAGANR